MGRGFGNAGLSLGRQERRVGAQEGSTWSGLAWEPLPSAKPLILAAELNA